MIAQVTKERADETRLGEETFDPQIDQFPEIRKVLSKRVTALQNRSPQNTQHRYCRCSSSWQPGHPATKHCEAIAGLDSARQKGQRLNAGKKEITAPLDLHEARQSMQPPIGRTALYSKHPRAIVVADQWILFPLQPIAVGIVQPGLLDELELPPEVRVEGDEDQPLVAAKTPPRDKMWWLLELFPDCAGPTESESRGFDRRICEPIGQL